MNDVGNRKQRRKAAIEETIANEINQAAAVKERDNGRQCNRKAEP